jgi:hypothetical protein
MRCSPVGATTGRKGREHGHKTRRGPFSFWNGRGKGHESCARLTPIRRLCIERLRTIAQQTALAQTKLLLLKAILHLEERAEAEERKAQTGASSFRTREP